MAYTSPKTWATNDVLTAADMNTYVRDNFDAVAPIGVALDTFTPTLEATTTNPTLGTGSTALGVATRLGRLAIIHIKIRFGTSGTAAGSGDYLIRWAAAGSAYNVYADLNTDDHVIGSGFINDSSASNSFTVSCQVSTANTVKLVYDQTSWSNFEVGNANPWTWGDSDLIQVQLAFVTA